MSRRRISCDNLVESVLSTFGVRPMLIGVPKEIKDNEFRVGLTPSSVAELVHHGHQVWSRRRRPRLRALRCGLRGAGATIVADRADDFRRRRHDREGQGAARRRAQDAAPRPDPVHLSASRARPASRPRDLVASGAICIAYETVTSATGGLPLLTPMSEVAGRLAPQVGAHASRRRRAGAACCSAACRACRRPRW